MPAPRVPRYLHLAQIHFGSRRPPYRRLPGSKKTTASRIFVLHFLSKMLLSTHRNNGKRADPKEAEMTNYIDKSDANDLDSEADFFAAMNALSIEFAARAIVRDDAFATNVEVIRRLTATDLSAAEYAAIYGGPVAFGRGALPADFYAEIVAVQNRVAELRHA